MRSQWAEFVFYALGFNSSSAALGNVSEQQYQGDVPLHIKAIIKQLSRIPSTHPLEGKRIKQINQSMITKAGKIVVFCDPAYLKNSDLLSPDDTRITYLYSPDPFGSMVSYSEVLFKITYDILRYCLENYPSMVPADLCQVEEHNAFSLFQQYLGKNRNESQLDQASSLIIESITWLYGWMRRLDQDDVKAHHREFYPTIEESQKLITDIEFGRLDEVTTFFTQKINKLKLMKKMYEKYMNENDDLFPQELDSYHADPNLLRELQDLARKDIEERIEIIGEMIFNCNWLLAKIATVKKGQLDH